MELLEWLWDAVAEPVLSHLGFKAEPTSDAAWPHIRWVTTGRLTKFPIHAAGYHHQPGCSVLDRVVSSYAFSVSSPIQDLKKDRYANSNRTNAIRSMTLVGAGQLAFVPLEISRLERLWDGIQVRKPESCSSEVLDSLKDCDMFHFAGHAQAHSADSLKSALVLDQDRLTVSSLLNINLQSRRPFLAYLSACGTSRMRRDELLNEGLHLVAALQVSGFRHVIGTLWDVDDEVCVDIAADVYSWMQAHGMDDRSVSEGLHHAVRKLRAKWISTDASSRRSDNDAGKDHEARPGPAGDVQVDNLLDGFGLMRKLRAMDLGGLEGSGLNGRSRQDPHNTNLEETEQSLGLSKGRDIADPEESDQGPFHWVPYAHFGS